MRAYGVVLKMFQESTKVVKGDDENLFGTMSGATLQSHAKSSHCPGSVHLPIVVLFRSDWDVPLALPAPRFGNVSTTGFRLTQAVYRSPSRLLSYPAVPQSFSLLHVCRTIAARYSHGCSPLHYRFGTGELILQGVSSLSQRERILTARIYPDVPDFAALPCVGIAA